MKKNLMKYFGIVSVCSFVVAVASIMTTTCVALAHEPEMPQELMK